MSVLYQTAALLPGEDFIYFGDNANAPYGLKTPKDIRRLSFNCARFLHDQNAKALLVACNTATSAAIQDIRAAYHLPVVSMEPAVKPACELAGDGIVLVMATPATFRQQRYMNLVRRMSYPLNVRDVPCGELVLLIEKNNLYEAQTYDYILQRLKPFEGDDVRAIVLGCTHFVFVRNVVQQVAQSLWRKPVAVLDGHLGTAKQLKSVLLKSDLLNPRAQGGSVKFYSSDPDHSIALMQELYQRLKEEQA